jgi:predicted dehydrogenase
MLELEGGTSGLYSATYESSGHEYFERGQEFYERIVGKDATLHVLHRWLVLCRRRRLPTLLKRGSRPETEESTLLDQLRKAITKGIEPECNARDNLMTMAVLEACVRSSEERRWVSTEELLGEIR